MESIKNFFKSIVTAIRTAVYKGGMYIVNLGFPVAYKLANFKDKTIVLTVKDYAKFIAAVVLFLAVWMIAGHIGGIIASALAVFFASFMNPVLAVVLAVICTVVPFWYLTNTSDIIAANIRKSFADAVKAEVVAEAAAA